MKHKIKSDEISIEKMRLVESDTLYSHERVISDSVRCLTRDAIRELIFLEIWEHIYFSTRDWPHEEQ
jgi:hypothetical protein